MKSIVDAAIPVLTHLNYGYWGAINHFALEKISSWIAVYCSSYEFFDRDTICLNQQARDDLRETGKPSPKWSIAIGFANPGESAEKAFHRSLGLNGPFADLYHNHLMIMAFFFRKNGWICSLVGCSLRSESLHRNSARIPANSHLADPPSRSSRPAWMHGPAVIDELVEAMTAQLLR